MNEQIKRAYENGQLVLCLGAGCSLTSKDQFGNFLLSTKKLSEEIAKKAGWDYSGEPLSSVYSAALRVLGDSLYSYFEELFKHCNPSEEYVTLAKYVWPRIYTLNIDDAFDKALFQNNTQKVNIRNRFDKVVDQDQILTDLDLIKLNGSIDRIDLGFIFSANEYGEASSKNPLWYKELAADFYRYTFLFIGTKLNEPVFYHQISRYRSESGSIERRGYVLTPSATPIEKENLETINLEHISGSLKDFSEWLVSSFPEPPSKIEIACNRNPGLKEIFSNRNLKDREKYTSIFDDITLVSRKHLKGLSASGGQHKKVRNFYRGFKPEWFDIVDGVPAEIGATKILYEKIKRNLEIESNFIAVYGPAGSGKTTLLKQVALLLSDKDDSTCYYIERPTSNFSKLIKELEKIHSSRFCIFYDRLDSHALDLQELLESGILKNALFIGSESQRKWKSDIKYILGDLCSDELNINEIDSSDAEVILSKIELYGPWTRLSKMSPAKRINELVNRSKRQLLIGLLETTSGNGFEKIIENDFLNVTNKVERKFIILIGLATIHKYYLKNEFATRALSFLGDFENVNFLAEKLEGIISYQNNMLFARHPVYIRHLFNEVVESEKIQPVLISLLSAYTVYNLPVYRNVKKNELQLFKALINHKFLKDIFRSKSNLILPIYEYFEKDFENDGHFLLQYGLALRDIGQHQDSLEKMRTALLAFPASSHIEHALAQQELIIACTSATKAKAYDLLDSAKDRLENLNRYFKSRNAYPIVTLSDGHTRIIRKFEGDDDAIKIARYYANRISSIDGFMEHHRLKNSWITLTQYVTTGVWNAGGNGSIECFFSDN